MGVESITDLRSELSRRRGLTARPLLLASAAVAAGVTLAPSVLAAPKAAKPAIVSFSAKPAAVAAAGGTIMLSASVERASTCTFSVTPPVAGLPAKTKCLAGRVSKAVKVPANESPTAEAYTFSFAASGRGGAATPKKLPLSVPAFAPPKAASPWRSAFDDDFPGTAVDKAHWNTCYPWGTAAGCTNFGNTELEWYLPSQVQVSKHVLHLVAQKKKTAGFTQFGKPMTYGWRSGMVTSYKKFYFTYGYVQIAAQVTWKPGFWMGLWLHTESGATFPEIDVEESLGSRSGQALHEAHVGKNPKTGTGVWSFKLSTGYHTFGLDWEKNSIVWYVDGKCVPAVHPTATQKCFTVIHNVPAQPMYLIANFAIDGNKETHNGPTKATPSVGSFNVRYVEVFQHG